MSIEVRKIEVRKVRNNTFIPVYIHIHIQNQTLKSNISKTVRDREKVSMEVRYKVMYGLSNGENIFDLR